MNKAERKIQTFHLNRKIELMKQFDIYRDIRGENKKIWNELRVEWASNEIILKAYPYTSTEPIQASYWDGKFKAKVTDYKKVCICTNVMGRLEDLSQTLPDNIDALKDYPNLEFTLLNYGDKSGVDEWIKDNMMEHIDSGLLKYYRVLDDIEYYSMSHSRNVCMRLAGGLDNASHDVIVNQVDCDNFLRHNDPKAETFPFYVNRLAHEVPEKAIFGKGKRLMHGRIGFYKDEFLQLGGYDESLVGYGTDDRDLYNRAMCMGYSLAWYGARYVRRNHTPRASKVENMKFKDWRYTEEINKIISLDNMEDGIFISNIQRHWGKSKISKNFKEEINM